MERSVLARGDDHVSGAVGVAVSGTRDGDAAGFAEDEVVVDAAKSVIRTTDPDGPNLFIYQFGPDSISYSKYFGTLNPARGWLGPGISGRRYPKVDIHSSWFGDAGASLMVSVIVPSPDDVSPVLQFEPLGDGGAVGFSVKLSVGSSISYLASAQRQAMAVDGIEAGAHGLLVYTKNSGRRSGIVLDCDAFRASDGDVMDPHGSAEFAVVDGEAALTAIEVPTSFEWYDQALPRYGG